MKKTEPLMPKTNSKISFFKKETCQEITRLLMFLIMKIKSDITFAILIVNKFAKNQFYQYIKAIKTILLYIKGSKDRNMIYRSQNKLFVKGYSDFNWAGEKKSCKSIFVYIFILNRRPVS